MPDLSFSRHRTGAVCAALLLLVAGLGVLAPAARAGGYAVSACGSAPGWANNSWSNSASTGMVSSQACPREFAAPWNSGIVDRVLMPASDAPHSVPGYSGAYHHFVAPYGTTIASISQFSPTYRTDNGAWQAGVWIQSGGGPVARIFGNGIGPMPLDSEPAGPHHTIDLRGRAVTHVFMGLGCARSACDTGSVAINGGWRPRAYFNVGEVVVNLIDPVGPRLGGPRGALWGGGWHRGAESVAYDAGDNTGIQHSHLLVDGRSRGERDHPCNFTRPLPCSGVSGSAFALDTRELGDGNHVARLQVYDAANNEATVDHGFQVDNHAPSEPRDVRLVGGEGWRTANGFDVRWTNPPGQVSPVAAVRWRACPDAGGPCSTGRVAGAGIERIAGFNVPADGAFTLRLWLEDAAGNADAEALGAPVHLRLDATAPAPLGFLAPDPSDPRTVRAIAGDATSGIATAVIELQRIGGGGDGDGGWHPLATSRQGDRLSARLDEDALGRGGYRLRVRATDAAGNAGVGDRLLEGPDTGGAFTLSLPVRAATRLLVSADRLAPGRRRRSCRTVHLRRGRHRVTRRRCRTLAPPPVRLRTKPMLVPFGARVTIRGSLTDADGRPLANTPVGVGTRLFVSRAPVLPAAATRTDGAGRFVYRAPAGASRAIVLSYAGDDRLRPTSNQQGLLVRAAPTLRLDRARVRNGQSIVLSGHLRGRPYPEGGKLVALQAVSRGRWVTFAVVRSRPDGSYRHRYTFQVTRGVVTYRLRAQVRRERAYPYELGYSPVRRVTVRG